MIEIKWVIVSMFVWGGLGLNDLCGWGILFRVYWCIIMEVEGWVGDNGVMREGGGGVGMNLL